MRSKLWLLLSKNNVRMDNKTRDGEIYHRMEGEKQGEYREIEKGGFVEAIAINPWGEQKEESVTLFLLPSFLFLLSRGLEMRMEERERREVIQYNSLFREKKRLFWSLVCQRRGFTIATLSISLISLHSPLQNSWYRVGISLLRSFF